MGFGIVVMSMIRFVWVVGVGLFWFVGIGCCGGYCGSWIFVGCGVFCG